MDAEACRDLSAEPGRERRVALFGGSFDPPHRGHVAVARTAAETFALDTVMFTPTGLQPLKPGGATAAYADRVAMVSLVCALDARFCVSGMDAPRGDGRPNYTVDTLEALSGKLEEVGGVRLFAIAGADSFLELPRWYRSRRLLELAEWIVVSRPGFALGELSVLRLPDEMMARVHLLETVHERVSATELRARLERGEDCSDAVSEAVLGYAREHHLY